MQLSPRRIPIKSSWRVSPYLIWPRGSEQRVHLGLLEDQPCIADVITDGPGPALRVRNTDSSQQDSTGQCLSFNWDDLLYFLLKECPSMGEVWSLGTVFISSVEPREVGLKR